MSDDSSSAIAKPSRPHGVYIALLALCSTVFLFFAGEVAGSLLVSIFPALRHLPSAQANAWLQTVGVQFAYGIVADGIILVGVMFMLKRLHWNWRTIGLKVPKIWHVVFGAAMAVPYYIFLYGIVLVLSIFVPSLNVAQKQELGFDSLSGGVSIILAFVSLVVIPPFVEEIVMRGYLYTGLRQWLPKIAAALVVSALFGLAHLPEGGSGGPLWIGAIDTFTLSLFLVGLREMTGNLWAGITLHMMKNCLAYIYFVSRHLQ